MTGKNITLHQGGKAVMTREEQKQAADAERARCKAEGFDEGLRQGRHEAHHARKYVQVSIFALGALFGLCAGVLATATMYEESMSRGVMIGGAVARAEDQRPQGGLKLRDQYTREGE